MSQLIPLITVDNVLSLMRPNGGSLEIEDWNPRVEETKIEQPFLFNYLEVNARDPMEMALAMTVYFLCKIQLENQQLEKMNVL